MSNAANYINKWHEVILEGKMELLDNLLSDNATDELIKTDSYPANAGFVKAMYAPPMAYGLRFQKDF